MQFLTLKKTILRDTCKTGRIKFHILLLRSIYDSTVVLATRAQLASTNITRNARAARASCLAHGWPLASDDGAQRGTAIVFPARSAGRAHHFGSFVLGHAPNQIVVQELTATAVIQVEDGGRSSLTPPDRSSTSCPRRCCEIIWPRAGRVWA